MSALNDKLQALITHFEGLAPTRTITRQLKDSADRARAELVAGVFTIVLKGERDYSATLGREAQLGTAELLIVGQVLLAEAATGLAVEQAELALVDDLHTLARSDLPAGLGGLILRRFRGSQQLEAPYGWVAADFELLP